MEQKRALKQLRELSKEPKLMRLAAEDWVSDFETLISIILSARTRDETTIEIGKNLFKKYPDAEKLAKAKQVDVEKIIRPVNYYRNKSRNIINCAKRLKEDFGGKVPYDIEKLITLPGVGRKTANVFLSENGKDAIGVDTHVSYISQKLGWTKNSNPHKIEADLQNLFPKKYWSKVNSTLVRFGKSHTSRKEKDRLIEEIKTL